MILHNLAKVGAQLTAAAGVAISDISQTAIKKLLDTPQQLDPLLERAAAQLTPIEVVVSCVPNGLMLDDYELVVDYSAFDTALKTQKLVRPKIIVRAVSADLNRDLLANRLTDSLLPLFATYQTQVDEVRQQKELDDFATTVSNKINGSMFGLELSLNLLMLCLIGAGALVSPLLWLLIGLGGFAALKEVPGLLVGSIKQTLFGTEIEQLEREVQNARNVVTAMVRQMTITVDPTLDTRTH